LRADAQQQAGGPGRGRGASKDSPVRERPVECGKLGSEGVGACRAERKLEGEEEERGPAAEEANCGGVRSSGAEARTLVRRSTGSERAGAHASAWGQTERRGAWGSSGRRGARAE
jgi:hypothetical protein